MKVFPAGSAKAGCLVLRFYVGTVKNTWCGFQSIF